MRFVVCVMGAICTFIPCGTGSQCNGRTVKSCACEEAMLLWIGFIILKMSWFFET